MKEIKWNSDRLRLAADLWLYRHGPWWLVLTGVLGLLLGFIVMVMPRLDGELAAKVATLNELQVRVANRQEPAVPAALPAAASAAHYQGFRQALTDDEQVLPSIKAVLDAAESHHPVSYTHLDVYKRQACAPCACPALRTCPNSSRCSSRSTCGHRCPARRTIGKRCCGREPRTGCR